jgi:myo-inositol-1-phosphate synthase
VLEATGAEILLSYLPVGSQKAVQHYAEACLATGVSLVNCVPVFVVSNPEWGERFRAAGIPCAGDDIKSQVGATIVHRMLARLFADRGVQIERTYQLNTGGNTDFLNRRSPTRSGPTTSTSAPATTCPGSTTTRSASCASKAAASVGLRSSSKPGSRCRIRRTRRGS